MQCPRKLRELATSELTASGRWVRPLNPAFRPWLPACDDSDVRRAACDNPQFEKRFEGSDGTLGAKSSRMKQFETQLRLRNHIRGSLCSLRTQTAEDERPASVPKISKISNACEIHALRFNWSELAGLAKGSPDFGETF